MKLRRLSRKRVSGNGIQVPICRQISSEIIETYLDNIDHKIQNLIDEEFPSGVKTSEKIKQNGILNVLEETREGEVIGRSFNPDGSLRSETLTKIGGEKISRSYFPNGTLKGFLWERADGINSKLSWYPNGYKQGIISERWRKKRDGRTLRIL